MCSLKKLLNAKDFELVMSQLTNEEEQEIRRVRESDDQIIGEKVPEIEDNLSCSESIEY